jgi:2-oxoisovalerate ferredoxin oxidoreductase delta subunit
MGKIPEKLEKHEDLPPAPMCFKNIGEISKTGFWRAFRPILDKEKCNKCYICWKFCPEPAIDVESEEDFPEIDYEFCKGCGICANECPKKAIEMVLEGSE